MDILANIDDLSAELVMKNPICHIKKKEKGRYDENIQEIHLSKIDLLSEAEKSIRQE